jgi:hypothetical protein
MSCMSDDSVVIDRYKHSGISVRSSVTRPRGADERLLPVSDAYREAEEMLAQFDVLYPTEPVLRLALRGAAAYQLSWFDANI